MAADVRVIAVGAWFLSMCMAPAQMVEAPDVESVESDGSAVESDGLDESASSEPPDFVDQPQGPTRREHQRRFKRYEPIFGPTMLSAIVMAGADSAGVSVSAARFVIPWLGLGFDIDESLVFEKPTYNDFAVAGNVWVVMTPHLWASPYARAGLGAEVFSRGLGVYGQWKSGLGMIVRLDTPKQLERRFAFGLGVEVLGRFPNARFERNLSCVLTPTPCSLAIRPEIGLSMHF